MSATGETQPDSATRRWVCSTCGFVYDPAEGDEDGGIPLGTAFEDIPEDWICPVCGARKRDFRPMEAGEELS